MKYLFIILTLFSSEFCVVKNQTHSDFWKNIFDIEKLLSLKGKEKEKYEALYGKMEPNKEFILYKNGDRLSLSGYINDKNASSWDYKENPNKDDVYFKKIEYVKSQFNQKPTYKIYGYSFLNYPTYNVGDFLNWANTLTQIMIQDNEPEKKLNKSVLYQFVCSKFNCFIDKKPDHTKLTLRMEKANFYEYPNDYKNLDKLLQKMKSNIQVFSGKSKLYQVESNKNSISLVFYHKPKVSIPEIGHVTLKINLELNYYGLKVSIKNLGYKLIRSKNTDTETLIGYYHKYPKYYSSGNLFHIFSPKFVSFFLPKDIDAYLKDYFDLVVTTSKHQGQNFKSIFKSKGNKVEIETTSYREVLQNKHKPFFQSTEPKKGEKSFFKDMQIKIVEDLKP
ncbi:MAG: hypothetical protein H7A23_17535 [Leptospiraceae bacterium]|nr:hypothetical protein [Leptospiraceae bacterium]MCP5496352.1 hypothetical protein [Leptospiraceae bacterium]